MEVDGRGNLFTAENIDFKNGLYATFIRTSGQMKNMNSMSDSESLLSNFAFLSTKCDEQRFAQIEKYESRFFGMTILRPSLSAL